MWNFDLQPKTKSFWFFYQEDSVYDADSWQKKIIYAHIARSDSILQYLNKSIILTNDKKNIVIMSFKLKYLL